MQALCARSCTTKQPYRDLACQRRQFRPPLQRRQHLSNVVPGCSLTTATTADAEADPRKESQTLWSRVKDVFCPFEDSSANARFLALALGGMLCSIATLIHDSYLPIFMRDELGMSNSRIGSVQALSQLLCQISKSFSGVMGDILGSQVKILIFGTFLTALSKPLFAASQLVFTGFGAAACLWCITVGKLLDRVSKGFREAPTKALISQTAQSVGEAADSAFSMRQSFVTIGSLAGSAVASAVFFLSGASYITTFAVAIIPPCLALAWLTFAFRGEESYQAQSAKEGSKASSAVEKDPAKKEDTSEKESESSFTDKIGTLVTAFSPAYWQALAVVSVLYFGRFDFTWVTLRAKAVRTVTADAPAQAVLSTVCAGVVGTGLLQCAVPKVMLPMLASVTMLATTLSAFTVGQYAKGKGVKARNIVLVIGFMMLLVANTFLSSAWTASPAGMLVACGFIGVHMGMTHGLTLSMVSSYMPHHKLKGIGNVSGTAWSFTDMVLGCILAASNQLAGKLTDLTVSKSMGNVGCFLGGSVASIGAAVLLLLFIVFGELGKELPVKRNTR